MTLIEWKPEFSLGVPQVDAEHRELIDLINRLHQETQSHHRDTKMVDFLEELYASTKRHFAHEELMMQARGYTAFEQHRADHKRLLNEVMAMMSDYQDGTVNNKEVMAQRLYDWFCAHFQTHDAPLHRLVHSYIKL
jgi:hemerythrin-like metal-binding protein